MNFPGSRPASVWRFKLCNIISKTKNIMIHYGEKLCTNKQPDKQRNYSYFIGCSRLQKSNKTGIDKEFLKQMNYNTMLQITAYVCTISLYTLSFSSPTNRKSYKQCFLIYLENYFIPMYSNIFIFLSFPLFPTVTHCIILKNKFQSS